MPAEQSSTSTSTSTSIRTSTGTSGSTLLTLRWCAPCGDERPFELPPCEDDHGADCPDLACVECGHAIVVGLLDAELPAPGAAGLVAAAA